MSHRGNVLAMILFITGIFCYIHAEFYPQRMYLERKKTSLDYGWKFQTGEAAGNPYDPAYDDAGWTTVNIPHSASYDAPTPEGERGAHQGICWYRKVFTVPPSKHSGKIFIEFEAAMQTADVWLNGQKLGTHDNSGYTWFSFDITDELKPGQDQEVAGVEQHVEKLPLLPAGSGVARAGVLPAQRPRREDGPIVLRQRG